MEIPKAEAAKPCKLAMPVVQPCSLNCGRGLCLGGMKPIHGEESQAGGLGDAGPPSTPLAQVQGVRLQRHAGPQAHGPGSF